MVVKIEVSGFEEKNEELTLQNVRKGLLRVSNLIFNKVVDNERMNVLMWLKGRFKVLSFEDLEEVYDDGCLVLWEKMMNPKGNSEGSVKMQEKPCHVLPSFWKEGAGVVEKNKVRPIPNYLIFNRL